MHIGAWQEYKLYKILVLRENYKKSGLHQLSTHYQTPNQKTECQQNENKEFSDNSSAISGSISNSAKTSVTDQHKRRLNNRFFITKRTHSNTSKVSDYAGSLVKQSIRNSKDNDKPSSILKQNYKQWANYEAAKEKAVKVYSLFF